MCSHKNYALEIILLLKIVIMLLKNHLAHMKLKCLALKVNHPIIMSSYYLVCMSH
jgi:hypothetical protein